MQAPPSPQSLCLQQFTKGGLPATGGPNQQNCFPPYATRLYRSLQDSPSRNL